MTPNAIRRILIVGGGSSGWMAALYLARFLRNVETEITLVESAQIGTIGVGEATIPSMVRYIRLLRLDEAEFMRRCNATYKLGISFENWLAEPGTYFHAFGLCGGKIDAIDLFHFWHRNRLVTADPRPYASYSLQATAAAEGKAPRSISQTSPIIETGSYAFHLDAAAMAEYLRELSIAAGVRHIFDEITGVETDGGMVRKVRTAGGRELQADLYIDCTGFAGVLIQRALGDPWIDLGHLLLCDRAVVLPQEKDEEMLPMTRSTAVEAGWMWRIPLSHRTGSGYVYSSAHISDDDAAARLVKEAGFRRARAADPRTLKMRIGHRTETWRGNVVALGLSSGFVEPLESTGLYFVHRALELLRNYFPDRRFDEGTRAAFNRGMRAAYDEARDFILLHYVLNTRTDTDFWHDARSVPLPESLAEVLAAYDDAGMIDLRYEQIFGDTNYFFVLSGSGRLPSRPTARAEVAEFQRIRKIFGEIDAQNRAELDRLPSHRAYVQWLASSGTHDGWPADESAAISVTTTAD